MCILVGLNMPALLMSIPPMSIPPIFMPLMSIVPRYMKPIG